MRRRTFLGALTGATAAVATGRVAADRGRTDAVVGTEARSSGAADRIQALTFSSSSCLLAADSTPLTDDSKVAVFAEPTAAVADRDGNGDAVTYPDDADLPLVAVDGDLDVVGIGATFVNDGDLVPELAGEDPLVDLGNEEFLVNCYDEYVDGNRILVDESHGQFYGLGKFRNFEAYAADQGYDLVASSDLEADLPGADGVVITSPSDSFSDAELTALSEFAADGGAVFLHDQSDFNDFDATANLNDVAAGLDLDFRFNDGEAGDTESNLGVRYLLRTSNFNEDFPLFDDRPGIVVDLRRGRRYDVTVDGVADGDTFDVRFSGDEVGLETDYLATVRVLGIDTPESASVAASAERPEEWEGLAYDVGGTSAFERLKFDSPSSLLNAGGNPLTDDTLVAVYAEDTASNGDNDGNGDAVSYPDDASIPLVAVDGGVVGLTSPFVHDGAYDSRLENEEFLLNVYDELVDGGRIIFDESHDQFYTLDKFGKFQSDASDAGYDLVASSDLEADLPGADGVVITSPSSSFSDAELTALSTFAADGGAVFLHDQSDFNDFDATANLDAIAAELGVGFRFNDDQVTDPENNAGEPFVPTTTAFNEDFPFFEPRSGGSGQDPNTTPYLIDWAEKASTFATERLDGQTVSLYFDENEPLRDPTRLLAYAEYDADGDGEVDTLYNEAAIEEGYARVYGSSLARHDEFWAAERDAREAGRGLWAESDVADATPYRDGAVEELFFPEAASVHTTDGAVSRDRVPVFAADTATQDGGSTDYDEIPLVALDESARVAVVGAPIVDESYEADEGYPVDTADYGNFSFLSGLAYYLSARDGDVLIDGGHGQFGADYALSSEDAAYFQRHLEGDGVNFEQVNDPTAEKLSRGQAYVVTTPVSSFTDDELRAVESFRDDGGAVLLLGSGAAPTEARRNLDDVAAGLGTDLRLNDDAVRDGTTNVGGDPAVVTTTAFNDVAPVFGNAWPEADVDGDGTVDDGELSRSVSEWVTGQYSDRELQQIIDKWVRGG